MPCAANIRETRMAIGFKDQADVLSPNIAAEMVSFTKLNETLAELTPVTEDDSAWIGKGDEFATQSFLSSWGVSVAVEKYCSSQFLAQTIVYALGHFVKAAAGTGFSYTCTPADPVVDCIEMKPFSYLEAIRQGGSYVLDRVFVGMCVEEFQVILSSGPGLNNSRVTATYVGTGRFIQPSLISVPAISTENILGGGSVTLTVNGVDYVSSHNIVSCQFGWKNNVRLDSGYFPGSGTQDPSDSASGAVRGRMEFGNRVANMQFVARFVNGSPELATLRAQTTGTAVVTLTGAQISAGHNHALSVTFQKVAFRTAVVGSTDGIVTVSVDLVPIKDAVNGLVTMVVTTDLDNVGS